MKFTLDRPNIIKDAENTFHLIKVKNKFLGIILEIILALIVFFAVEMVYGMISGGVAGAIYGMTNRATVMEYMSNNDIQGLNDAVLTWDYFTPISLVLEVLMTVLTVLVAKFYQRRKVSTVGFIKKDAFTQYLLGMALGLVLFSVAELIAAIFGSVKLSYDPATFKPMLFAFYFVGWLFQGMAEEVLCRGFIMVSVARKHSLATAVIFNSVFFAGLHLGNSGIAPLALVNLTLFGIFASIVFIKTGNIWLVSAMHSIWNMVQGNLFGVLVSGGDVATTVFTTASLPGHELINGGDFGLEGGLAVTIVYVIGIAIALLIPSKKSAIEEIKAPSTSISEATETTEVSVEA